MYCLLLEPRALLWRAPFDLKHQFFRLLLYRRLSYLFVSSQIGFLPLPLKLIAVDLIEVTTSKHLAKTIMVQTTVLMPAPGVLQNTDLKQSPMAQVMVNLTNEFVHPLFCGTVNAGTKSRW